MQIDINEVLNIFDRGEMFFIYGTIKGVSEVVAYKIRGWANIYNDTVTIEGLVLKNGSYIVLYHAEFALFEISLINHAQISIDAARDALLNVIAQEASLEGTLNEYSGEPKDLLGQDSFEEKLLSETDLTWSNKPICMERKFKLEWVKAQETFDKVFNYIMTKSESFLQKGKLFNVDIEYSFKISVGRKIVAHTLIDSAVVFDNSTFMVGVISYYDEDHKLIDKEPPSMSYVSENLKEMHNMLMNEVYSMMHFIRKLTNDDINILVKINEKEK